VQKKVGDDGHLPLALGAIMKHALTTAQTESGESDEVSKTESKAVELDGATKKKLETMRTRLFQEFYGRFAHDYEKRAELKAHRDAYRLVSKRLKRQKKLHPGVKVTRSQKIWMYSGARKEVDNRAVRKYQRLFKSRLKQWTTEKLYEAQESLKNTMDNKAMAEKEKDLAVQKKMEDDQVKGKSP